MYSINVWRLGTVLITPHKEQQARHGRECYEMLYEAAAAVGAAAEVASSGIPVYAFR